MKLRNARLCLDCEELHQEQQCPTCASESFTFLTRWVPSVEKRKVGRTAVREPEAWVSADARPASNSGARWVTRGIAGVALVALSRWLWQSSRPMEWTESGGGRQKPTDKTR